MEPFLWLNLQRFRISPKKFYKVSFRTHNFELRVSSDSSSTFSSKEIQGYLEHLSIIWGKLYKTWTCFQWPLTPFQLFSDGLNLNVASKGFFPLPRIFAASFKVWFHSFDSRSWVPRISAWRSCQPGFWIMRKFHGSSCGGNIKAVAGNLKN